jgi:hypothetical protein
MNGLTWPFADNDSPNHPFLLHPKLEVPNPGRIRLPNQELSEKATNHSEKKTKNYRAKSLPVVKSSDDPCETPSKFSE